MAGATYSLASRTQNTRSTRCSLSALGTGSGPAQLDVGVVIVDHGSRKKDSNEMLVEFGKVYQEVTGCHVVEIAHMEIAEPTIEQAVGKCTPCL